MYTLGRIVEGRKCAVLTTDCFIDASEVITQYGQRGCRKICGKLRSKEKCCEMTTNMTEYAWSAVVLTEKYSNTRVFALKESQSKNSSQQSRRANFERTICEKRY